MHTEYYLVYLEIIQFKTGKKSIFDKFLKNNAKKV